MFPNSSGGVRDLTIYFKGRSLILVPNIRQEKCYFCVLMCCTCSAVHLAERHLKVIAKIGRFSLQSA